MNIRFCLLAGLAAAGLFLSDIVLAADGRAVPRLKVSDNRRFLAYEDDRPFFYLGDTAWELFHRSTREEADVYLANRAEKGFTVIQTVALGEFEGVTVKNAYGCNDHQDSK